MITEKELKTINLDSSKDEFYELLGLTNSNSRNTLSFIDDARYLKKLNQNSNITGVITNKDLSKTIIGKKVYVVADPRYSFFTLQNNVAEAFLKNKRIASKIDPSAKIHSKAFVDEFNVTIGKNTIIEPNVTIFSDVEIGNNCIIRSGAVIGTEGFEYKKTTKGILAVKHDGKVIIGDNVNIGSNSSVSKGFSYRNTIIGNDTKIDSLVQISHCVHVGQRCLLPASTMVAGSVTIENDVWVGPSVSISSQLRIQSGSSITLGSVVMRNVLENQVVTGDWAIPHLQFLKKLKNNF
tara:strand:+ start:3498 stop:4379 length:882 start_codon:yes stop_codon:yes gene_type:complete